MCVRLNWILVLLFYLIIVENEINKNIKKKGRLKMFFDGVVINL